jgi:hypothetical protein
MKKFKELREHSLEEKLKASDPAGKYVSDFVHSDNPKFAGKSKAKRIQMALAASYAAKGKSRNEEVEQIDELSKSTLGSYVKKATSDAVVSRKIGTDFEHRASRAKSPGMKGASTRLSDRFNNMSKKRQSGVGKAVERLTKEDFESVEEGIMNAVKTLASKAGKALTGGSDEDQRKDLQRKMGVPQTGKKPMQK